MDLLPDPNRIPLVTNDAPIPEGTATAATRDHAVIRRWAGQHGAIPATGEASSSGPATSMSVKDGGAGIRFNFPGASRLRPISWDEWLGHFDRERLTFVFDIDASRGARYRLVRSEDWENRFEAQGVRDG